MLRASVGARLFLLEIRPILLPRAGTTFTTNVPTQEERMGNFSHLPLTQRPRDPRTGRPFPDGIIPAQRLNPIALAYLDRFVPLPNNGGNSFIHELITSFRSDQFTARMDHNIGSRDNLRATFFYDRTDVDQELARFPIGTRRRGKSETKNFILSETHTFSPHTVNQFIITVGG
jgi:hypothetical protein